MQTLQTSKVVDFILHEKNNNIDKLDNLQEIPELPAVYAISGRINGKPANCRFLAQTDNLRAAILRHFSAQESNACLAQFMQSIKIKSLDYLIVENSTSADRETICDQWRSEYTPDCNEVLNKVF